MINLKNIKDALSLWRTELDKLESALEQKLQRLAFLQESPLPPNEVADFVLAALNARADYQFSRHMIEKLGPAVNSPLLEEPNPEWLPALLGGIASPNTVDPSCLYFLLKEQLAPAIRSVIENFDGFPPAGPPLAQRKEEISKLEREIEQLRTKVAEERQAAKVVGLDVAGMHQRDRIPARTRDLK